MALQVRFKDTQGQVHKNSYWKLACVNIYAKEKRADFILWCYHDKEAYDDGSDRIYGVDYQVGTDAYKELFAKAKTAEDKEAACYAFARENDDVCKHGLIFLNALAV